AQLLDAARPRCRHHDPIAAATAEPGRLRPPALERGILRAASDRLGRERRREPRPALVLPHVHRLRPLPGRAEKRPHGVAELLALLLADRAPVRGHVVHVIRAVMPDDVDELVDVDSAVHERYRWVARGDPRYCIHLDIFVQREESAMERLGIEPLSVFGLPPVAFVDLAADLGLRYIAITLTALPNPYGYAPFSLRDDSALRRETIAALRHRGVSVSLGDGFVVRDGVDMRDSARDIAIMAELGAQRVNTVSFDPDPNRT